MEKSRRRFLAGTAAVAGLSALGGYRETLGAMATFSDKGARTKDTVYGNAEEPEVTIGSDGKPKFNPRYKMAASVCNGCPTHCGVRVKIDRESGEVVRTTGNPYSLLSSDPWLPYDTPLAKSYTWTSGHDDSGNEHRSTACARGNVVLDKLNDKFRVLRPLKRVGKRGEDRWEPISIEQLMREVVDGGNLFGEGHVDGLRSIYDPETPIDSSNPEMGPKSNQLAIFGTGNEGRQAFMVQRFAQSFGTPNFFGHTSICGLSMRAGEAAFLSGLGADPHLKPDFEECEFLLTIGTSPAQAGNPFKRQAKLLARARSDKNLKYVVVGPMLTNCDSVAVGNRSRWLPIKPGEDLALVMGMIRWIVESDRHNRDYLQLPSAEAMEAAGEPSFTNATHLIIQAGDLEGHILVDGEDALVIDADDDTLKRASSVRKARLEVDETVQWQGRSYRVKSAFTLMKAAAFEHTLEEYSSYCGVPVQDIEEIAREFTSHGRKVAIDCHGGTMHTTGFYTTYAIMMLGGLVGNLNYRGGMSVGGGKFRDFNGPRYNMVAYTGKTGARGYRADRARRAYEDTKEYRDRVAAGKNPYPAKDTWYPFARALVSEVIVSSINEYPYKLKALISWNANFVYGQSGFEHILDDLKDPQRSIPLIVAIDPFINESSRYADYIIPDAVLYETWGVVSPWNGYLTKANNFRYPIVDAPQEQFANGEPITMDSFVIELGKVLGMPGFGANAINGQDGSRYPMERPEDFYLRVFENVALDGTPVPDASDEEIELAGIEHLVDALKRVNGSNWRKVAYCMARGGRFADKDTAYRGKLLGSTYRNPISIYSERVGNTRNSLTGQKYSGVPRYYPQSFTDGTPVQRTYDSDKFSLRAFSYKSSVLSQASAASEMLTDLRYTTYVDLNPVAAQRLGLKHGDVVKVTSPGGSIEGLLRLRQGVHPEAVAIEHGAGREGEGAVTLQIGNETLQGRISRRSGISINKIGMVDNSRQTVSTMADFVVGSNARQAIPVQVSRA
ncbi:molybdopterin-dependent oxidoreductase [Desulfurispira natronophila]|uniref:Tetrathionate reductase subunit A n=1 Tax=Desulfurispira natronophila TaxID=682562 RepID=A0A7W7Y3L0_9BACT|nr:molybdopterin-dependent oxidoreductase [Desulfurispira natronophila]MBB5021177.1 tetrathionate reductase subunit A [Desulfurispira natronophila]